MERETALARVASERAARRARLPAVIARPQVIVAAAVVVGMLARFAAAASWDNDNWDQRSYEIVVDIMRRGGNVYLDTQRYNYSPLWSFVLLGLDAVARSLHVSLHFAIGAFLSLIDLANAVLIARIASREGSPAHIAFAAMVLNPVAVLISAYQGQFETLAALPILATLAFAPRFAFVWLLGTASIVVKHLLTFSVWALYVSVFGTRRAIAASVASGLVFAALFVPYALGGAIVPILGNVFLYNGLCCFYGFASIVPDRLALGLFAAVMSVLPFIGIERLSLGRPALLRLAAISLVAFIPGFGQQYFMLPVLFAAYAPSRWYVLFTLVASVWLVSTPDNVGLVTPPFDRHVLVTIAWLVALLWMADIVRKAARLDPRALLARDRAR